MYLTEYETKLLKVSFMQLDLMVGSLIRFYVCVHITITSKLSNGIIHSLLMILISKFSFPFRHSILQVLMTILTSHLWTPFQYLTVCRTPYRRSRPATHSIPTLSLSPINIIPTHSIITPQSPVLPLWVQHRYFPLRTLIFLTFPSQTILTP